MGETFPKTTKPFIAKGFLVSKGRTLSSHCQDHTAEVRDQPNKPDEETVPVEAFARLLGSFPGHNGSPASVEEHQPKSQLARQRVRLKNVERL